MTIIGHRELVPLAPADGSESSKEEVASLAKPPGPREGGGGGSCDIARRLRSIIGLAALIVMQYGLIGPCSVYVATSFFARPYGPDDCELTPDSDACRQGSTQLAFFRAMAGTASNSVAWIFALALGSVSDGIGRRPILRLKVVTSCVPLAAFALHVYTGLTLWCWLLLGPFYEALDINGVVLAVMSDLITDTSERATAFGVLIASVVGFSAVVLPFAGLLPATMAVAGSLVFCGAKVVYLYNDRCFPETAPAVSEDAPVKGLITTTREACVVFGRNSFIMRMVAVLILSGLAVAGLGTVLPPVMTGYIGLKRAESTFISAVSGVSILVSMACVLRPMVSRFGDVGALKICLGFLLAYCCLVPFCANAWHVTVLSLFFVGPMVLQFPLVSAIKSNLVAKDEQGLVQGALAAVRVIATALADPFFGWFYKVSTQGGKDPDRRATWPPFLGVILLAALAFCIACSLPTEVPPPPPSKEERELDDGQLGSDARRSWQLSSLRANLPDQA